MRKWWYLVFVFLTLAVFISVSAFYLSENKVKRIQGGIVIVPGGGGGGFYSSPPTVTDPGTSGSQDDEGTIGTTQNPEPEPDSAELSCWECPLGGSIRDIFTWELTDQLVIDLTDCEGISQMVQIDCTLEFVINESCGNGICEQNESNENCPADCPKVIVEPQVSEQEEIEEEEERKDVEPVQEAEEIELEYYHRLTFDLRCVKLFGKGVSNCYPDSPGEYYEEPPEAPQFSPEQVTVPEYLIKAMFGLP